MKTIECKFCKEEAIYSPIDELKKHAVNIFFCHTCRAEYLVFPDGKIASTSLYTDINEKMYRWTVASNNKGTLSLINNPGIPGTRKNGEMISIKSFNDTFKNINITPDNIKEKIQAWLIFL